MRDKPQTLDHLEDNIRRVIADIRPQVLEKVIENWTSRLDYIRASCGSTMPEIILKSTSLYRGLTVVYSHRTLHEIPSEAGRWFSKFRPGDLSLLESDRSGRPSKIDNDVLQFILENNPHLTSQEIAEEFGIHHTTVGDHIKSLGFVLKHNVEAFWVKLIYGDEKWILYENIKIKKSYCKPGTSSATNCSKTKYPSTKSTALFVVGQERSSVLQVAETGENHQRGSALQSTG
ncbi:histone-lysine N-methyltransferase SETMAR [Trichonephila clavipes]|nr:histone-lysine N-methyltransferase SETMAR [Trichonephila clavipes]